MKVLVMIKKAWHTLSGYLPVIMMLLFAMLTYWLLQVTPHPIQSESKRPSVHSEDYFMRGFEVTTYDQSGDVRAHILGNYAKHYADTDSFEIEDPVIYAQTKFQTNGIQKSQTTAKLGISNADSSLIELKGQVILKKYDWIDKKINPDVTKMMAEYLKIDLDHELVTSNLPIRIEKEKQRMIGDSMDYDNLERRLSLRGNVRVIFEPK
jgi:lipopolysaccharide export system protein LptC